MFRQRAARGPAHALHYSLAFREFLCAILLQTVQDYRTQARAGYIRDGLRPPPRLRANATLGNNRMD